MTWQVGDRVALTIHHEQVSGTVTGVDKPGLPRGVRVRLDWLVSGVDNCYASHDELRLIPGGGELGE